MTLTRTRGDFFVFALMLFLVITLPVSQAASISYLSPEESATATPATVESGDAKIISAAVSEVIINVSKDGKISIIGPNGTDIPALREAPESSQNVSVQDDNVCSRADNLELNTWYSAYIDYKGDIDWSKWDLPSSGKLTAELDVPSGKDYDLEVYSGCSSLRCTSAAGAGSDETCTINANKGYVYAKVYGYGSSDYSSTKPYYIKGSFTADKPDLVPGDFSVTPSSPDDDDSVTVRYHVVNNGPNDVKSSFNFKLYIDNQEYQKCLMSGQTAGSTYYCDRSGIVLSAGSHTLKNVVDADNQVSETNENNNVKTQSLSVSAVPKFDLVPGDFSVTPGSPDDDDSVTVRYRSVNNGPNNVNQGFNFKLYIDDVLYGTCIMSGQAVGDVYYCDRSGIVLGAGAHTLKNVVDADSQVSETNENNNVKTQSLEVKGKPDLVVIDIWTEPSDPDNTQEFDLKFSIDNTVQNDVTGQFYSRLYMDGALFIDCKHPSGIADGTYQVCTRSDVKLAAGKHGLKVITDYYNDIPEKNENNNERTEDLQILKSKVDEYDLIVTSIWAEPSSPVGGSSFDIKYQIGNDEPTTITSGFISKLFIDNALYFTCSHNIKLEPGYVHECANKGVALNSGTYQLKVQADYNNDIKENDEGNNIRTKTLVVSSPNTCPYPDGASASCDCDYSYECPSSRPYCEDEYPWPISDGYDGCVTEKPQYCGDSACNSGETWQTCSSDCAAPTGKINVDVTGSNGNPVSGAYVYLDGTLKGTTGGDGKKAVEATYGEWSLKINCPDNAPCETRTINVDGTKYASFKCNCAVQENDLQIRVRTLHTETEEGYPIHNAYVFLDGEYKGLTNVFGNLYISKVSSGSHKLGIALKIADNEGSAPYEHKYSADISVDKKFEEKTINIATTSQQQSSSLNAGDADPNAVTVLSYNQTYVPQAIPIIVVAAVAVGFIAWSYADYAKCVEETDSWWDATWKQIWYAINCNPSNVILSSAINKERMNSCVKKISTITQNTLEKCQLEGVFLLIGVIPGSWVAKAVGKVFLSLKGGMYSIPYVERFLGYSFKVIKESDTFIKISDGTREFGFKLIGGSLKIYDNVVGMIVKVMDDAGVSKKLVQTLDDLLRTAKPSSFPAGINAKDFGQVKGELGEMAAIKTADTVSEELAKEGATFFRQSGKAKDIFKENYRYKLEFNEKGKLNVYKKSGSGPDLGDFDDFYLINEKPIITEVKTRSAASLDEEILGKVKIWPIREEGLAAKVIRRLNAFKEVTGETPEFILMIPKGEAAASKELQGFLKEIKNAGFRQAESAELKATDDAFSDATRRINKEAGGGKK